MLKQVMVTLVATAWMTGALLAAPDLSTPKSAALAFAKALEAGDVQAAQDCALASAEKDRAAVVCLATMVGGFRRLDQAAIAKFGDAGKLIAAQGGMDTSLVKKVTDATEKIEGDTAEVKGAEDKSPLMLKKADGQWKVDIAALTGKGEDIGRSFPMMQAIGKAAGDVADGIAAGQYKTAEEAKQDLGKRAMALLVGTITTQPSSQPATKP